LKNDDDDDDDEEEEEEEEEEFIYLDQQNIQPSVINKRKIHVADRKG